MSRKGRQAKLPVELKKLRACLICSLIKSEGEFEEDGCDNCEGILHLSGTRGSLHSYTSSNFEGMIAMMDPKHSWVAKWQHIGNLKPGLYAVNVRGELSSEIKDELNDSGLRYYNRDKSQSLASKQPTGGSKNKNKSKRSSLPRRMSEESDAGNDVPDTRARVRNTPSFQEVVAPPSSSSYSQQKDNVDHHTDGVVEHTISEIKQEMPGAGVTESVEEYIPVPVEFGVQEFYCTGTPAAAMSSVSSMPYRSGRRYSESDSSDDSVVSSVHSDSD